MTVAGDTGSVTATGDTGSVTALGDTGSVTALAGASVVTVLGGVDARPPVASGHPALASPAPVLELPGVGPAEAAPANDALPALAANRLSSAVMPGQACPIGALDVVYASPAQVSAHLNALAGCLMDLWSPLLASQGYALRQPVIHVYSGSITTGCGTVGNATAFYCPADGDIYFDYASGYLYTYYAKSTRYLGESVISHEFAHAIQQATGLLTDVYALYDRLPSASQRDELMRRVELQATCLSGAFIGKIAPSWGLKMSDANTITAFATAIGDDKTGRDDHGTSAAQAAWTWIGFGAVTAAECDTFAAPARSVA